MDYSSRINTSLNLNTNPLRLVEEIPQNKEAPGNFLELGRKISVKEEAGVLVEELNRVSAENKKLTEMLTDLCKNYDALRSHVIDYTRKCQENELSQSKKRKSDYVGLRIDGNSESSSSDEEKPREEIIKAKSTNVYVRTDASDTSLVLKDGYQWKKYGQKVTRNNPCPRGYFKCSFAPSCPVKKKVQRRVEDQSILVATYEGEHNHPPPSQLEATSGSASHAKSKLNNEVKSSRPTLQSHQFHQFLVDQMAFSLTEDPNFTTALATAISERFSG